MYVYSVVLAAASLSCASNWALLWWESKRWTLCLSWFNRESSNIIIRWKYECVGVPKPATIQNVNSDGCVISSWSNGVHKVCSTNTWKWCCNMDLWRFSWPLSHSHRSLHCWTISWKCVLTQRNCSHSIGGRSRNAYAISAYGIASWTASANWVWLQTDWSLHLHRSLYHGSFINIIRRPITHWMAMSIIRSLISTQTILVTRHPNSCMIIKYADIQIIAHHRAPSISTTRATTFGLY